MREYLLKLLKFAVFFLFFSNAWAQADSVNTDSNSTENGKVISIDEYLKGYIANDLDLKELKLKVERAQANLDEIMIENGIGVVVSSGNSKLAVSTDGLSFEAAPSVTVSLPETKNTKIITKIPVSISAKDTSNGLYFDDVGVSLSREIVSNTTDESELTLEKYQRALLEAQQAVTTKILSIKASFWKDVSELYNADKTMKKNENSLYDDKIDFDSIIAKGYSENSSTYRVSELKIKEDEFNVQKAQRDLRTLLEMFAVASGFNSDDISSIPSIPEEYYQLELTSFSIYSQESYKDLENVTWDYAYNEKMRSAQSDFSLFAEAGYGYTGYLGGNLDPSNTSSISSENKISTGVTANYGGLSTNLGLSTTIDDITKPTFSFSISYDFKTKKTDEIDDRKADIDREDELLSIETAKNAWIEKNLEFDSTKATLEWTREQNNEQLTLYKEMYEDYQTWYDKGIIPETDLLQAKNSYETKLDDLILTTIDCITYNLEVEQLFLGEK